MHFADNDFKGFSKLDKLEKIELIAAKYFADKKKASDLLKDFWHEDEKLQKTFDDFSENTLSNFYFPFGVVPKILINDKAYTVPMVIEESSVVAAASKSAQFWLTRGGFKAEVLGTHKVGHVHFFWQGIQSEKLETFFNKKKEELIFSIREYTRNMEERGGGIVDLRLIDLSAEIPHYYQLEGTFETCDAMGANFINTICEAWARSFKEMVQNSEEFSLEEKSIQVVMSILSNYSPECRVRVIVECPIEDLRDDHLDLLEMSPKDFAEKFQKAILISKASVYRAVTHNKGIFNGIDAVVLASGNDFRAVEAQGHAWAARNGKYQGLTDLSLENNKFRLTLEIPLALGTVGGLTSLHPLSRFSLEMLGFPSASEFMMIAASIGLAQNFAAIKALVTSGIQKGHMKMHLMNILNHLEATEDEKHKAKDYFMNEVISFKSVREFISSIRRYS